MFLYKKNQSITFDVKDELSIERYKNILNLLGFVSEKKGYSLNFVDNHTNIIHRLRVVPSFEGLNVYVTDENHKVVKRKSTKKIVKRAKKLLVNKLNL